MSNFTTLNAHFPASGTASGSEFQVNTFTFARQFYPSVAVAADGDFVVVWQSDDAYGDISGTSIQGQRFHASGMALGDQFQVNTYTTLSQRHPSVAVDAESDFVVVWHSSGSSGPDTAYTSIQGQRLWPAQWIFVDGFEPGDTTAWSGGQ